MAIENDETRPDADPTEDALKNDKSSAVQGEVVKQGDQPKPFTVRDTSETSFLNPQVYLQMKAMANDFIKSKAVPKGFENAEQLLVAFQTGYEMGMKPMESLKSLYLVNGQLNLWGTAVIRRLKEHGWSAPQYTEETQESVTATIRKGDEIITETYTFGDAKLSGYTTDNYGKEKIGWKPGVNRKLKLRYGVISLIIKSYLPEVLGAATGVVEVSQDEPDYDAINKTDDDGRKIIEKAEKNRKKLANKSFRPQAIDASDGPEQPTA